MSVYGHLDRKFSTPNTFLPYDRYKIDIHNAVRAIKFNRLPIEIVYNAFL